MKEEARNALSIVRQDRLLPSIFLTSNRVVVPTSRRVFCIVAKQNFSFREVVVL